MSKGHSWGTGKKVAFVILLLLLPLMLCLGFWQLDRAEQKRQLLEAWQQAGLLAPRQVLDAVALLPGQTVELTGFLDTERLLLLDNKVRNGKVGYEVIALLNLLEQPQSILVNLGWVAAPRIRTELPVLQIPEAVVKVQGRLVTPGEVFTLGETLWSDEWPKRIQQHDLKQASDAFDRQVFSQVLRVDQSLLPELLTGWPVITLSVEKHLGYAAQWFMMSFALFICLLIFGYKQLAARNWWLRLHREAWDE